MDSEPGYLRIADMDAAGIDRRIISLTCPGTQILDRDRGVAMATLANDQLARACRMAWVPAIMFCRDVLGPDRVMYAMDYPYEYTPEKVTIQDALPVDDAAKKAFFQGIAEQVFSLA